VAYRVVSCGFRAPERNLDKETLLLLFPVRQVDDIHDKCGAQEPLTKKGTSYIRRKLIRTGTIKKTKKNKIIIVILSFISGKDVSRDQEESVNGRYQLLDLILDTWVLISSKV
jgi:hypothetical protein